MRRFQAIDAAVVAWDSDAAAAIAAEGQGEEVGGDGGGGGGGGASWVVFIWGMRIQRRAAVVRVVAIGI